MPLKMNSTSCEALSPTQVLETQLVPKAVAAPPTPPWPRGPLTRHLLGSEVSTGITTPAGTPRSELVARSPSTCGAPAHPGPGLLHLTASLPGSDKAPDFRVTAQSWSFVLPSLG